LFGAGGNPMGGILGTALGESAAQTEARIEEAKKTATDLSGLVRKKNKDDSKPTDPQVETNGHEANGNGTKRKADDDGTEDEESKKAKVEATTEA
jgi:HAT1-interacting factor 1